MDKPAWDRLLQGIEALVPAMQEDAIQLDERAEFPRTAFAALTALGLLNATVSKSCGGLGLGDGRAGALALLRVFVLLGRGNLAIARLYEAHVNALLLIDRFGSASLVAQMANDAAEGHIFALWVTDSVNAPLALRRHTEGFILDGGKAFCSGGGVATRALITAATDTGTQMLMVALEPNKRVSPSSVRLSGMRAAITGSVDFSGMMVERGSLLGDVDDYMGEPIFSAGAWRGSACALGGLSALVDLHRNELVSRHRDADPHQRARFGQLLIAYETASLWTREAALRGCLLDRPAEEIVAYINLTRLAVEAACLDGMRLTQRSLGLGAFIKGSRGELICRDLATYLRQPATDEILESAAEYYFHATLADER